MGVNIRSVPRRRCIRRCLPAPFWRVRRWRHRRRQRVLNNETKSFRSLDQNSERYTTPSKATHESGCSRKEQQIHLRRKPDYILNNLSVVHMSALHQEQSEPYSYKKAISPTPINITIQPSILSRKLVSRNNNHPYSTPNIKLVRLTDNI